MAGGSLLQTTSQKTLPFQRDLHLQRIIQICEDLDTDERGYVSTMILAKILKTLPGVRPELLGPQPSPRFYQGLSGYNSSEQVGKVEKMHESAAQSRFKTIK